MLASPRRRTVATNVFLPWVVDSRVLAILILYLVASVVAFVAYGVDKSAAQSGRWRTPESTLHILALIGGWPGALIAQNVFRHKSRKASFRIGFFLTIALNCAALVWLWWVRPS